MDNIPEDIVIIDPDEKGLAKRVDLSMKFPPIGNQGNYGTCVAWATGYNMKTALDAIDKVGLHRSCRVHRTKQVLPICGLVSQQRREVRVATVQISNQR